MLQKFSVMRWLFLTLLTIDFANPLSQNLNELASIDDGIIDSLYTNTLDTVVPENPAQPQCIPRISPDDTEDNTFRFYRRHHRDYCEQVKDDNLPPGPRTTPDEPAENNPYKGVRYDDDKNVCTLRGHRIQATCGGPEILHSEFDTANPEWTPYVVNCLPGKFVFLFCK